ncbi:MAG: protein arginine kinase [Oscillospiraceae bacterium]|nr:protein arginine kinase [Oscillospiraceae bacterium]
MAADKKKEEARRDVYDDIAVSTRIRLARNLADIPFPGRMSDEQAEEILEKVSGLFRPLADGARFHTVRLTKENRLEARVLVEKHLISPEFAGSDRPHGVILSEERGVSVMVGEEDHIRIQTIGPGLCLEERMQEAQRVDEVIDGGLPYAFDGDFGYLTSCPTNLGTALRASVMLHLPALTESGAIREIIAAVGKMGLAVRGLYGEGSQVQGALYQVSNQATMGLAESEIISRVTIVVERIVEQERALRARFKSQRPVRFGDRVWRAWGLLAYARLLPGEETMRLLSDLRWGVAEGELPPVPMARLNDLLRDIQPGVLANAAGRMLDAGARDAARADAVRAALAAVNAKEWKRNDV